MLVARKSASVAAMAAFAMAWLIGSGGASAEGPVNWQLNLQAPATPVMAQIYDFHNELLVIITVVSAVVLGLLVVVAVRFREKRNPVPSKTAHHTTLEVAWTVIPVLILLFIATKSFPLLYFADHTTEPAMTVKAVGHQWYWSYVYPDSGNFTFDAYLNQEATGDQRLFETDNHLVVPVNTKIRLLITADDVLHAFAMPAFGIKLDAVPGKTNETWMEVTREGTFYGQCSELCGDGHGYMPIAIDVVSKEKFDAWVAEAQTKFSKVDGAPAVQTVAQAPSAN
ncbi:MAG: cytochrome c oxidase subunit II [Dongiaceae bacterium]